MMVHSLCGSGLTKANPRVAPEVSRPLRQSVCLGQFVLSKSAVSELTDHLAEEYEAFRTRALSGYDIAYLFIDTVYEPLRRWGSKTGVLCV